METIEFESRVKKINRMHNKMLDLDDERAYFAWINVVPDEPTREDFETIAENEKFFIEVTQLFGRLFRRYANESEK